MFKSVYIRQLMSLAAFVVMGLSSALASPTFSEINRLGVGIELKVLINQGPKSEKFPKDLFGLKVGEKYKLGTMENGDYGNLPIKKMTGVNRFLGRGFHLYFEPTKVYDSFPYIEDKKKPEDKYFGTSFHTYFLPIIPHEIQSLRELESRWPSFEVKLIRLDWSGKKNTKDDAYFWAVDLCKTFKTYLSDEGVNIDYYEDKWRSCKFRSGENVLEISNTGSTISFSLSIDRDQSEKLEQEVDDIIRRLEAKKLLE